MLTWVKRIGGGLALLIVLALAAIYGVSEAGLRRDYSEVAATDLAVPTDPATVERGRHLATAVSKCTDCHGQDLGGKLFIDGGPMGKAFASNLTRGKGGVIGNYTDAQLARLIRHGVKADGRGVMFMPSNDYYPMSDADVAALIAYLRTLPPVDRELEPSHLRLLGRALYAAGKLPVIPAEHIDHQAPRAVPAAGATPEYGKYLADIGGCTGCHRPDLSGGHVPGTPPDFKDAANLTPAGPLGKWTEADFFRALRKGLRPDGTPIDAFMPWQASAKMTDDELRAIWLYVKSVPAKATEAA